MTAFTLPRNLSRGHVVAGVREQTGPRIGTQLFRSVVDALVDSRRRKAVRDLRKHQAFGPLITVMHVDLTTREMLPFRRED
jgi:hypothetical protein